MLEQVRAAGVRVEETPDVQTLADFPAEVTFVGKPLGLEQQAADMAGKLEAEIAALAEERPELDDPPRVLFIISMRDGAPSAAGEGTAPDEVIEAAGGVNVAAFDGFKLMNAEAVIAATPDLLLMTSEHAENLGGTEAVLDRPEFALTPDGEGHRSVALPALTVFVSGRGRRGRSKSSATR